MPSVTHLDISDTVVTDYSPVLSRPSLHLAIRNSDITDLTPFSKVPTLGLDISGTKVKDLGPLESVPQLNELNISDTPVTNLSPLYGKKNLKLTMHKTSIKSIPPQIIKNLQELNMDMDTLTPACITALRKSSNLKKINGLKVKIYWQNYDAKKGRKLGNE